MWRILRKKFVYTLFAFLLGGQWAVGQGPIYKPGEYPAPRYPQVKPNYTMQELTAIAREVIRRPYQSAFLKAGYAIQPGHRALIVVDSGFEELVVEAIVRAIQEAGGRADVVTTDGGPNCMKPIADGSSEVRGILEAVPVDSEGVPLREEVGFNQKTVMNLAETGGYDILIYKSGGTHPALAIPWQYIYWDRLDKFVTAASFPDEVQVAIDDTAWEMATQARRYHITDPEGTDITWTIKPSYWKEAQETYKKGTGLEDFNIVHEGHISLIPLGLAVNSFLESDAEGVIAGTINHTGAFPAVRVSISKASVGGIEGGGTYGQRWREALAKWGDIQWPGAPGPGINKLWEVAVGTNANGIRPKDYMQHSPCGGSNSWERSRSGVIHWGMGARSDFVYDVQMPKEFATFRHEHSAPTGHVHIHTYFNTVDIETIDGKKTQLINKGRLTALDDPKVRQVAAKYGDPDVLLREIWIPGIPGINMPGDYRKDYATDPVTYIRKEIQENYKY